MTLVKIPASEKNKNRKIRIEEPEILHKDVNNRKRVWSLTAPDSAL